jgi:hypothetical protein
MTEAELVPEARCVGKVGGGRSEMEMMARAEEGRMRRVPKDFLKISAERRLNESRKKGNQPLDASAEYRRERRLTMLLRSPAPLLGKPPFPFPLLTSIGNLSSTTSPPSLSSPLASLLASRLDPPFASPRQTPSPRFGKAPPEDGTEKAKPVGRLPARECERDREAFGGAIGGECGREGGCCCGSWWEGLGEEGKLTVSVESSSSTGIRKEACRTLVGFGRVWGGEEEKVAVLETFAEAEPEPIVPTCRAADQGLWPEEEGHRWEAEGEEEGEGIDWVDVLDRIKLGAADRAEGSCCCEEVRSDDMMSGWCVDGGEDESKALSFAEVKCLGRWDTGRGRSWAWAARKVGDGLEFESEGREEE